jgi:DNA-binding LacI/PurR family transcriptional regulator
MVDICFVSHSRTVEDQDSSMVWTGIKKGVKDEAIRCNLSIETFSPIIHYFDVDEYRKYVGIAVKKNPKFLIISGAIDCSDLIKNFPGVCVIVNTKPDWEVPIPCYYVGMDDFQAGQMAGENFINEKFLTVLRHENVHAGHQKRVNGIREIFSGKIDEIFFNPEGNNPLPIKYSENIIVLGVKGAEKLIEEKISPQKLVIFDYKEELKAKLPNSKILFIEQDPYTQGTCAVCALFEKRDILIKPTAIF